MKKGLLILTLSMILVMGTVSAEEVYYEDEYMDGATQMISVEPTLTDNIIATFVVGSGDYYVAGQEVKDVAPYIKEGRTLLPIRYVAHALGAYEPEWNQETRTALVIKDTTAVVVTVGDNVMYVGDALTGQITEVELDVPAELKEGRVMLPLRAISEAFGVEVEWNNPVVTLKK